MNIEPNSQVARAMEAAGQDTSHLRHDVPLRSKPVGEGFDGIKDVTEALGADSGAMVAEYLGRSAAERERLYEDLYKSAREDLRKMPRRAMIAEARNDSFYRNLAAMGDIHRSAEDWIEKKIEKEFEDLDPERF